MATEQLHAGFGSAAVEQSPLDGTGMRWPAIADPAFWHKSTPEGVRRRYGTGDLAAGWKAWRKHLSSRRRPRPLARLSHGQKGPTVGELLAAEAPWIFGDRARRNWLAAMVARGHAKKKGADTAAIKTTADDADRWLAETAGGAVGWMPSVAEAWEAVAWSHALVPLAEVLPGAIWWSILERLHQLIGRAAIPSGDEPLAHQLVTGELPWTLAWLFPELGLCGRLAGRAAKALSAGISELLDGDGLPQCAYLEIFPRLVACWTRCRLLAAHRSGRATAGNCWDDDAEQQFPLAIREALRLSRHDGGPVLISDANLPKRPGKFSFAPRLAELAVRLVDDRKMVRSIRAVLSTRDQSKETVARLPKPATHSEWAELGVLQTDWSRRGTKLTAAYGESAVRLELESNRQLLLSGPWDFDVWFDGVPAPPRGNWEEVCWVSDADCDYLELEIELAGSVRIERQMLLSRRDRFLYLADAVSAAQSGELNYRGRLRPAADITVRPADETREVTLEGRKRNAILFPLALPEWRVDPRGGNLTGDPSAIELRQTVRGERLYAPLWIDLSPARSKQSFTWRQLSVAEQLQNLPRDVAAGYRVQFGKRQWVVYRSLAKPANRTLLGVNLSSEFFIGRFHRDGETKTVLEIE